MTPRAFILGLLPALLIAWFGYINDSVMRLSYLVANHMPISVFGLLLAAVIVVNPLLRRLGKPLRPAELAVIVAMMLVVCSIPGSGLMRSFTLAVSLPARNAKLNAEWQKNQVMGYFPPQVLAGGNEFCPEVIDGLVGGKGSFSRPISLGQVPWEHWKRPLTVWLPLIALAAICVICLAMVVHREWSVNERLRYPLAEFARNVLSGHDAPGGEPAAKPLLRDKLFWLGLAGPLLIHLINGLNAWNPQSLRIPMAIPLDGAVQKWPSIHQFIGVGSLLTVRFFPAVFAFAFMMSREISFSLGISQWLFVLLAAVCMGADVRLTNDMGIGHCNYSFLLFGGYVAMTAVTVYTGRRYYLDTLRRAVTFHPCLPADRTGVWACRVLLLGMAAMSMVLIHVGLDWTLTALTILTLLMLGLVNARVNAETGLFFMEPWWQPAGALMGLLGLTAIGPNAVAIIALAGIVLAMGTRECLMPFVINALKITDDLGVRPAKVGVTATGLYLLGLAGAVLVVLWAQYNFGHNPLDRWAAFNLSSVAPDAVNETVQKLSSLHTLEQSVNLGPLERINFFGAASPHPDFVWAASLGATLVLACSFLRLRFTWWFLHPVAFLVWNTYPIWMFGYSFLLGWGARILANGIGGHRLCLRGFRFMYGAIAGDLLGGLLWMAVGLSYYLATGLPPKQYLVFP